MGSLFSGIGGLELGLERAGLGEVVWQAESDEFCRRVLARHWPGIPCYRDVKEIGDAAPRVDLLCGGFPCQDVSAAGKRTDGIRGSRSGLWSEFARCIRLLRPELVVVENVPGLAVRGLDVVLGDLAALGFDAEWTCIGAAHVGAPHLRRRIFIVAAPSGVSDAFLDRLRVEWQRIGQQHEVARPAVTRTVGHGIGDRREGRRDPRAASPAAGKPDHELADAHGEARRQARDTIAGDGAGAPVRGAEEPGRCGSLRHVVDASGLRRDGGAVAAAASAEGQPSIPGLDVAHRDGGRCEGIGFEGEPGQGRQRGEGGDQSHGPDLPLWPPSPEDVLAWGNMPAEAQPAVCRLADGLPPELDWIVGPTRRQALKALGNAVVPACAEAIGKAIVRARG